MIDILYHLSGLQGCLCLSGTEEANKNYANHIHDIYIYNKFEQGVLTELLKRQKGIVKQFSDKEIVAKDHPEIGLGLIMDDLAYDKKMMNNPEIKEIFFNGRHYHITTMIAFQYMMTLSPEFRTNIDYVFVCRDNRIDNIKRLHQYFFGIFDKLEDFKKVFYACTNDYGCLVLDNNSKSSRIEDSVFWYKAKPDRKFKIGTPEMWKIWDKQLRDKNDEEEKEERVSLSKSNIREVKKMGPKQVEFEKRSDNYRNDRNDEDIDDMIRWH
jgi:hypothetical protein